jgi:hypothetical protein
MKKKIKSKQKPKLRKVTGPEKKLEEQDYLDKVTDFEDHEDPEYPFDEKVKYPAAQTGENNSFKK